MTAPAWARARALGVFQLSCFGAQAIGSALWGAVGTQLSVHMALVLCAGSGALAAVVVRPWRLSAFAPAVARSLAKRLRTTSLPQPQTPAPALARLLNSESGRVLEAVHYRVDPADRDVFLVAMREVHQVRLRAGAVVWRLYEDVAQPDHWTELWAMESWTDHLREEARLDEAERVALARATALHRSEDPPRASRYLNVHP